MKGAGILFTDGKKVLVLRRKGDKHAGKWCFPGGKPHNGELPINTARRESREEIGHVEGEQFAQFNENGFFMFLFKINKPFIVKLSKEHDRYEWTDVSQVTKLPLHPKLLKTYPKYAKAINSKFPTTFKEWLHFA